MSENLLLSYLESIWFICKMSRSRRCRIHFWYSWWGKCRFFNEYSVIITCMKENIHSILLVVSFSHMMHESW